jgi:hypothetical protein
VAIDSTLRGCDVVTLGLFTNRRPRNIDAKRLLAAYALELGLGGALLLWAICGAVGLVLSVCRRAC